jgi:hypothetical protein
MGTVFMLYAIYFAHPNDNRVLGTTSKHAQCVALKRQVNLEAKPDALECIEVTNNVLKLYLEDERFWTHQHIN